MDRHEKFLQKVVLRMTRDPEATKDVVQECFIKAYRRLGLFEGRSSLRSWLYQIALNTARNRFRKTHREILGHDTPEVSVDARLEDHVMTLDVRAILLAEIERLPERQREALQLRVYDDLSFKEIADIMRCPYDTAKANYRHALMKLKSRLEGHQALKGWVGHPDLAMWAMSFSQVEVEAQ